MQRALDSAIGLPRSSTSVLWILGFLMPADVSRSFTMPLLVGIVRGRQTPLPAHRYARVSWPQGENMTTTTATETLREQLQDEVAAKAGELNVPGAAIGIYHDGEEQY